MATKPKKCKHIRKQQMHIPTDLLYFWNVVWCKGCGSLGYKNNHSDKLIWLQHEAQVNGTERKGK